MHNKWENQAKDSAVKFFIRLNQVKIVPFLQSCWGFSLIPKGINSRQILQCNIWSIKNNQILIQWSTNRDLKNIKGFIRFSHKLMIKKLSCLNKSKMVEFLKPPFKAGREHISHSYSKLLYVKAISHFSHLVWKLSHVFLNLRPSPLSFGMTVESSWLFLNQL